MAKVRAMKMENEKLALERSIHREMEDLRGRLSDATDELEFLRALDTNSVMEQMNELKSQSRKSVDDLSAQCQQSRQELTLQKELVVKQEEEMANLRHESRLREEELSALHLRLVQASEAQTDTSQLQSLEKALAECKQNLEEKTIAYERVTLEVNELQLKLNSLTSQGETSTVAGPAPETSRLIRGLQRDVAALKRDKDALEKELAESDDLIASKDAEIFALTRHIPLPSDTALEPVASKEEIKVQQQANAEKIATLEEEKLEAQNKVQQLETMIQDMSAAVDVENERVAKLEATVEIKETEIVALGEQITVSSLILSSPQRPVLTLFYSDAATRARSPNRPGRSGASTQGRVGQLGKPHGSSGAASSRGHRC